MLPKATLNLPPRGGKHHRFSVAASLKKRHLRWRDEGITQLWLEYTTPKKKKSQSSAPTLRIQHVKRALYKGREGHYGKAIQCLQSSGVAAPDNPRAQKDLHRRHPQSTLPTPSPDLPSALAVLPETVRTCLSLFPKDSSPGASNLRIQHLVDACRLQLLLLTNVYYTSQGGLTLYSLARPTLYWPHGSVVHH